jgi:hypothetical protein
VRAQPVLVATLLMALDAKLGEFGNAMARITRIDFFAAIGDYRDRHHLRCLRAGISPRRNGRAR